MQLGLVSEDVVSDPRLEFSLIPDAAFQIVSETFPIMLLLSEQL